MSLPFTYAIFEPSLEKTAPRPGNCAGWGWPPSGESCIVCPPRLKYSHLPSALQVTAFGAAPPLVMATGFADPSEGTTYRPVTPARSQINATRLPSRDHTG